MRIVPVRFLPIARAMRFLLSAIVIGTVSLSVFFAVNGQWGKTVTFIVSSIIFGCALQTAHQITRLLSRRAQRLVAHQGS